VGSEIFIRDSFQVLGNDGREAINIGLQYVNNDACFPSLMVVGQMMEALLSGKYDTDRLAFMITQTGGGCRATNYIAFIRRALAKAGYPNIPVISLNLSKLEANPGFKINLKLLVPGVYAAIFGDIFMRCVYRMRPYEITKGSVDALHKKWVDKCIDFLTNKHPSFHTFNRYCKEIIQDFDLVPISNIKKPRVGIVGEILVKFMPAANNHLAELLEKEGAEAVCPDLLDFMLYSFYNQIYKAEHLGKSKRSAILGHLGIYGINFLRKATTKALQKSKHFEEPADIFKLVEYAQEYVSIGNQTGEGWFLTGEMMELYHNGVPNIVCTQPFGCLPNHVVGKGVIKQLRKRNPGSNIVAIDYDPGASEVNQLNRIKLMLSTAYKNMDQTKPS
jgi:predicted nucleotide-binding protein (sugar kinase/HSP70/actin superfamily)